MKKSYRNTNRFVMSRFVLLFMIFIAFTSSVWAKRPVAIVSDVEGSAFLSSDGNTLKLKMGDEIPEFAQVFTEVGAKLTITDHYDHKIHLAGSTHVSLMKRLIELKRGYLWVQSFASQDAILQSANTVCEFNGGEGIFSFNPKDGKSQLMVIKGKVNFFNQLMKEKNVTVFEGNFSFVQKDYEEGVPRRPTPIGFDSFKKVTKLFRGVEPLEKIGFFPEEIDPNAGPSVQRTIASVESPLALGAPVVNLGPDHITKKGRITIRRKPAAIDTKGINLKKYYREKLVQARQIRVDAKIWKRYSKKSGVQVRVFGTKQASASKSVKGRRPSSISTPPQAKVSRTSMVGGRVEMKTNNFNGTIMKEYKRQMRHNEEVNQLIQDLESYDQDYQVDY